MQEMQESRVLSLGLKDPLEEKMATYSRIPAWKIPRTEEPGGLQSLRSQRVEHNCIHIAQLFNFLNLMNLCYFIIQLLHCIIWKASSTQWIQ